MGRFISRISPIALLGSLCLFASCGGGGSDDGNVVAVNNVISSVEVVDFGNVANLVQASLPPDEGGPNVSAPANAIVTEGGAGRIDLACEAPTSVVLVSASIDGNELPGLWQASFPEPRTSAKLMLAFAPDLGDLTDRFLCRYTAIDSSGRAGPTIGTDTEVVDAGSVREECLGQTCETFVPCEDDQGCGDPVCAQTTEGFGRCVEGSTNCDIVGDCETSADCPNGGLCVIETCCGRPVCAPPEVFCNRGGAASSRSGVASAAIGSGGPTIGSR